MEHVHTPIATPEQRQALRRSQQQRLRDQAEALLRAVEALEPPKIYVEAERAAKTLLAVGKVLDAVNVNTPDDGRIVPASVRPPQPHAEREALTRWKFVLDRSLESLAEARRSHHGQFRVNAYAVLTAAGCKAGRILTLKELR